jgi:hypothetical protein
MRPLEEFDEVHRWVAWGLNDCQIQRLTGIPRGTIRGWRHRAIPPGTFGRGKGGCLRCDSADLDEEWYAYLLGMYLGDGHVAALAKGVYSLRITLDETYPMIIEECRLAMERVRPGARVSLVKATGCIVVQSYWKHWACLFPQHGPGPKHRRAIRLEDWQETITARYPGRLLRGLIHSDGWRGENRVKGKTYPRYQFTNHSADIRDIFCRACDELGIQWRQMTWRIISVARRPDVAKLDRVVGPKS